jgi:hypothetical protein
MSRTLVGNPVNLPTEFGGLAGTADQRLIKHPKQLSIALKIAC